MPQLQYDHLRCDKAYLYHYLCEFGSGQDKEAFTRTSQDLLLATLITNATDYPIDHVICLEGHVTHTLFACDAQTSCLAGRHYVEVDLSGSPGGGSCSAPMTPLPPYFRCHRGLQVAYTVVCNHRQDCADGSDEDFCVFPACRPGTDITCSNQQVSFMSR